MDLTQINLLAVLVAALSNFVLGSLWYSSLLFQKPWMRESGMTEEKARKGNMAMIFGTSFVLTLIMAFNLAAFLGPDSTLAWGAAAGALAGVGWVAASTAISYLYEQRSLVLFLINGGYQAVTFIIMGAILGAWH